MNTTLFYLANHPRVMRKLDRELRACFPNVMAIHPNTAENCKYLRACLDEAMRLAPSVPSNIPRLIGQGGLDVLGNKLPEGCWVSVPNFTLFRNGRYFERPHEYVPERWIADEEESGREGYSAEDVKRAQTAFQPFSLGPRHCIARNLALREMTFALARVFYLFDVEPLLNSGRWRGELDGVDVNNSHLIMEQWDVFTSLEKGPAVKLKVKDDVMARL